MYNHKITDIKPRMIIDSRGNPTVEVDVHLENGAIGRGIAPSGASTGDKEALELRDKGSKWCGKGVETAIGNVNQYIKPALLGMRSLEIEAIDLKMINLDGTDNKAHLGANATLAVSLAVVQAGAHANGLHLFQYLEKIVKGKTDGDCQIGDIILPMPMMNILNGGSHADNNVDIQEFMIMPTGFNSYSRALQSGVEIFHALKGLLKKKNYSTAIGDEGGFAPNLKSNSEALELILESISLAGYKPGQNIFLALDVAASEFYNSTEKVYHLESTKKMTSIDLIDYYKMLCDKYPIVSIEDGLDQNDWNAWQLFNTSLGNKIQIVGDDLTVTNPRLLQQAIDTEAMNAILIKLNQIGTFTETIDAINLAKANKYGTIISHRSGETEDTFIADLSVATSAGQIKTGSLCRTDRTAKYNQLLRIEELLGVNAQYADISYLGCEKIKK